MPQTTNKITALYCRLSKEDMQEGNSVSIHNQKMILERYAKEHYFKNLRFYVDDGITGVTFDRNGFKEMLSEIEAGNVSTVIINDLSRLGRNYLKSGELIEIIFPENDVRFIAINDGVDTAKGLDDFVALKNWVNELYAHDTSRKIRAVLSSKAQRGERVNGQIPYGYVVDPNDRNHLLVDAEAAPVVRKIFEMYAQGAAVAEIRRWLRERKICSPAEYKLKNDGAHVLTDNSYEWSSGSVECVLKRAEYIGTTVTNKTHKISFKVKKQKLTDDEERYYFPNTHEPIVDEQIFELAQRRLNERVRRKKNNDIDILSGAVFCGSCGSKMHSIHGSENKRSNAYTCGKYRNSRTRCLSNVCSANYIKQDVVLNVLFADLKRINDFIADDERGFISLLSQNAESEAKASISQQKIELEMIEKRLAELNSLFRKAYEDNSFGKISDSQFSFLTSSFDEDKAALEEKADELRKDIYAPAETVSNVKRFITLIKKYSDARDELNYENIHGLVERIVIHEADINSKTRKVEIYYRYVGKILINALPPITVAYRSSRMKDEIKIILS